MKRFIMILVFLAILMSTSANENKLHDLFNDNDISIEIYLFSNRILTIVPTSCEMLRELYEMKLCIQPRCKKLLEKELTAIFVKYNNDFRDARILIDFIKKGKIVYSISNSIIDDNLFNVINKYLVELF